MCLVTLEAQIEEVAVGRFALTVTTGHLGDTWTSKPTAMKATTWDEANEEAVHVTRCFREAILGGCNEEDNRERTQPEGDQAAGQPCTA
jgi:hypothetical protein